MWSRVVVKEVDFVLLSTMFFSDALQLLTVVLCGDRATHQKQFPMHNAGHVPTHAQHDLLGVQVVHRRWNASFATLKPWSLPRMTDVDYPLLIPSDDVLQPHFIVWWEVRSSMRLSIFSWADEHSIRGVSIRRIFRTFRGREGILPLLCDGTQNALPKSAWLARILFNRGF